MMCRVHPTPSQHLPHKRFLHASADVFPQLHTRESCRNGIAGRTSLGTPWCRRTRMRSCPNPKLGSSALPRHRRHACPSAYEGQAETFMTKTQYHSCLCNQYRHACCDGGALPTSAQAEAWGACASDGSTTSSGSRMWSRITRTCESAALA